MSDPETPYDKLRVFAEILVELAWDQDPPSGYFEGSLDDALEKHHMTRDDLDALSKELGFEWRCQDEPDDPKTLCKACGGGLAGSRTRNLCSCAEGAKVDRGAELRYKGLTGECLQSGCSARADVDGWCDEHSDQFKRYGTHHAVGPTGPPPPRGY